MKSLAYIDCLVLTEERPVSEKEHDKDVRYFLSKLGIISLTPGRPKGKKTLTHKPYDKLKLKRR